MEPAFQRGDILVLDNTPTHMEIGEYSRLEGRLIVQHREPTERIL